MKVKAPEGITGDYITAGKEYEMVVLDRAGKGWGLIRG